MGDVFSPPEPKKPKPPPPPTPPIPVATQPIKKAKKRAKAVNPTQKQRRITGGTGSPPPRESGRNKKTLGAGEP